VSRRKGYLLSHNCKALLPHVRRSLNEHLRVPSQYRFPGDRGSSMWRRISSSIGFPPVSARFSSCSPMSGEAAEDGRRDRGMPKNVETDEENMNSLDVAGGTSAYGAGRSRDIECQKRQRRRKRERHRPLNTSIPDCHSEIQY
jgi:hypothetical protein